MKERLDSTITNNFLISYYLLTDSISRRIINDMWLLGKWTHNIVTACSGGEKGYVIRNISHERAIYIKTYIYLKLCYQKRRIQLNCSVILK